jgi:hypothetical protein
VLVRRVLEVLVLWLRDEMRSQHGEPTRESGGVSRVGPRDETEPQVRGQKRESGRDPLEGTRDEIGDRRRGS